MRAVIPTIITQALWSDAIRLGALDTTRDFTFVRDTAAGFVAAAEGEAVEGEVFNLGHGRDISVADLAERILAIVERDVPIETEEARLRPVASEVGRMIADASKARETLERALRLDPRIGGDETRKVLASVGQ